MRPGAGAWFPPAPGLFVRDPVVGNDVAERRQRALELELVTTNDNTSALRFYQRRGWVLAAVHVGGIEASRRIKPSIPARGNDGIPIRDELELECALPPFGDVVPDDWVPDE